MDARHAEQVLKNEKDLIFSRNLPRLRIVRQDYFGLREEPKDISQDTPAGVVFYNLQLCYNNQHNVSEGIVEDVIWGFRQSGIPNGVTWDGFKELQSLGYMTWTDDVGIMFIGKVSEKFWYKWTPKYFNLLSTGKVAKLEIDAKIQPKTNNWDNVK